MGMATVGGVGDGNHYEERVYDLSSGEVGRLFGVSSRTVRNWASAGLLPAIRTPGGSFRFNRDDVSGVLRALAERPAE